MSTMNDMIDAAAKCSECYRTKAGGCDCWVKCGCGWLKLRGARGCRRCMAVVFTKTEPNRTYEATIGRATLITCRLGIHWTYYVRAAPGEPLYGGHTLTNTNKAAMALGTAAVFRAQDAEGT